MTEVDLENINRNDWKHNLKDLILGDGKSTVEYEAKRYGYTRIDYRPSNDGTEIMDVHYMSAGECISRIRVEFSNAGRANRFSIYV